MEELSLLFHGVAAVYHIFALLYPHYYKLQESEIFRSFGGQFKFLTIWGHLIQVGYFIFAAAVDLYNYTCVSPSPRLKRFRDGWFSALVFPVSLLVFILFWGIYSVNKELLVPKNMENTLDPAYNHMVHTFIIVWSMVEPLVTTVEVPKVRLGLIIVALFATAYTVWSYIICLKLGKWLYPVLNVLSDTQRFLFIVLSYLLAVGLFLITREYQKKFGRKPTIKTE